ncbi:MAG: hypothetical protein K2O37_07120, partial [Bacteroidales bacterium]|nr:hypothetical protein [Bacteroidales bacterium]
MKKNLILVAGIFGMLFASCSNGGNKQAEALVKEYAEVKLTADLSRFSEDEKQMMAYLCDAAEVMDDIFWKEAYIGNRDEFLASIKDCNLRKFAQINYGPWDRLNGNHAFMEIPGCNGLDDKPLGANFYPLDMTREEFDALEMSLIQI